GTTLYVGLADGAIRSYRVLEDPRQSVRAGRVEALPAGGGEPFRAELSVRAAVAVDEHGTLTVEAAGQLGPVVIDPLPVIAGAAPIGWRRPNPALPRLTRTGAGCVIAASAGDHLITRRVDIADGVLTVRTEARGPAGEFLVAPWVALRRATKTIRHAGAAVRGPVVTGVWPPNCIGIEPAAEAPGRSPGAGSVSWAGAGIEIAATWESASSRHEGQYLPLLRAPVGEPISYTIEILDRAAPGPAGADSAGADSAGGGATEELPAPPGIVREPLRPAHGAPSLPAHDRRGLPANGEPGPRADGWPGSPAGDEPARAGGARWGPPRGRHGLRFLEAGGARVAYCEPAGGLVEWSASGTEVLRSTFPAARTFGPYPDLSCGLWASASSRRESPLRGVDCRRPGDLEFRADGLVPGSWGASLIDADPDALLLRARPDAASRGCDAAFYVLPNCVPGAPVSIALPGSVWTVEATRWPWVTTASAVAVPLRNGRFLAARPATAAHSEAHLRSTPGGLLVTLLQRVPAAPADPGPSLPGERRAPVESADSIQPADSAPSFESSESVELRAPGEQVELGELRWVLRVCDSRARALEVILQSS
ncbi:MAG: hypothetical protein LBQ06_08170, partial [Frankiaceae bacterium]|nr:hypothetical protein [Frankiaceae bacterium]